MTTDPPLFSIVTVTKDNLEGLKRTAASITGQSSDNYEWIVIDGNSADGTKDYLASLPARATSEKDGGIYDAMNKGIGLSRGDYIIFMNAGDVFSDIDILATIQKSIRVEYPDFLYGDALETSGFYKKARSHEKIAWGMFTHHQAMIYRKDKIGELRYDTGFKIAADYDFTARFLKQVRKIHYVPCAICIFEEGGVSQQKMQLGRIEQLHIRKSIQISSPFKNRFIYGAQSVTARLKKLAPAFYRLWRSLKVWGL